MRVLLGDKIYCSQLFSGFEPSTPSERVAVVTLLFSNGSEPMTAEACKALDTQGHRAGWSMELIQLNVIVEHPITPLKTQSLLHISDIFLRDPSSFDKPQTIQISDMTPEHPGPQLTWRSPDQSYSRYCFKEGQAKEAYPTSPPLGQSQTYSELSSFQFVLVVPEPSDTITEAGIVWWEYRAALMSQTGCRGICRIAYPDRPHVVDLLIDWDSADNSAAAKAEAVVIQRLDSLASHLAATPWPSPLSGTPFASLSGDIPWAEVVDFNLLPTATFSDRRAFEFYIHDFCGIMDSDPYFHDADGRLLNDISPDQAVDDIHVGWIDRTDPSTIVDNSRSPISVTYRILFTWTSEKDERHWIKEFMESQYQVLGYRAHAVALLVEDVRGTIFTVEKEVRSNFRSADEHSDSDESLGF
ncbi:hypothetical protein MMC13_002252 [Lambiella insularis]|nr:hypothetical protein [Lambiella insularis]